MKKKKYKKPVKTKEFKEPETDYSNTVTVTTFAELERRNSELTERMTHIERMVYLQKLNENMFGTDLSEQMKILKEGEIFLRPLE